MIEDGARNNTQNKEGYNKLLLDLFSLQDQEYGSVLAGILSPKSECFLLDHGSWKVVNH